MNERQIAKAILDGNKSKWELVQVKGIELLDNSWGYCVMPLWKIENYENEQKVLFW